ncbi:uncharacterized protein LOC142505008 [Primulina tabacum]|uniref:uncharacterized protein LOC142505008 n=1 Tax=Primulina tabacum TaxID=48773 RepID=UPI003F5ADABF
MAEDGPITWQTFRREFLKQYYPTEFRLQKLSEFESFKQTSDITVIEYNSKLNDLGTYVPTIMADETLNMHRLQKGLNSRIQSVLVVFKPTNFADLMGAAMSAETDIKRREEEGKHKRPFPGQSFRRGQDFKRPNQTIGPSKGAFPTHYNKEIRPCPNYSMRHSGECYRNIGACFKCGKLGHWIADCPENKDKGIKPNAENHKPRENKPNARIFAITQEEANNANDVVAGTILINKMHAYVLFDCGATHSFVSKIFAKKQKLEGETLSEPLRVATPVSKTIETYKKKSSKLQTPNHKEIIYHGRSKEKKSLLSVSQTLKAMKSGEEI